MRRLKDKDIGAMTFVAANNSKYDRNFLQYRILNKF